ncbi:MAG TPA: phenylacetate--CoA ligase family protein, partial [Flavobacterium sp.]
MLKIFDLTLTLNGFPIKWAKNQLEQIVSISEKDFGIYTEERKRQIVEFHLKHNTFYRSLVGKSEFIHWEDLPVMKKSDFQRPLVERLSSGFTPKNVYVNKTSGSSGDPFVFAKDKECHALIWANIMRRFAMYNIDFNCSYQARFYGMPLDFAANKILRLKDFLSRRYRFSIFDLSDAGLAKITAHFQRKKFDYINGYTSSI